MTEQDRASATESAEDLRQAQAVLDRYVEVAGGKPAYPSHLRRFIAAAIAAARAEGRAGGPYHVGLEDAEHLVYAGATFTHEVYDSRNANPYEPIAVCDEPEQAARLVALLNSAERRGCEALDRAAEVADGVASAHERIPVQGKFTSDYRSGAVDAARHVAETIRALREG